MRNVINGMLVMVATAALTVGCAAAPGVDGAPEVDDDSLDALTVDWGQWDVTANAPSINCSVYQVNASAAFKRLSGGAATRVGGYCIVRKYGGSCNTDADCSLDGEYRYCFASAGTTTKTCWMKAANSDPKSLEPYASCSMGNSMTLTVGQTQTLGGAKTAMAATRYATIAVLNEPYAAGTPPPCKTDPQGPNCSRAVSAEKLFYCPPSNTPCDTTNGCRVSQTGQCICS